MSDTSLPNEQDRVEINLEVHRLRHELGVAQAQVTMARGELRQKMHDLAREFRVPLASVLGFTELLGSSHANPAELSQITLAGQQLMDLVRQMERIAAGETHEEVGQIAYSAPESAAPASASTARTILHIEDNEGNYRLIESILEDRANIGLMWASSGKEGFEVACKRTPGMVLLDLNLPDMHGSYLLSRLRNNTVTRNIPVVVLSADTKPGQVEQLMKLGARNYLTKPFDVPKFLSVVDEVFADTPA